MNYIIRLNVADVWWASESTLPALITRALEITPTITVTKLVPLRGL